MRPTNYMTNNLPSQPGQVSGEVLQCIRRVNWF